MFPHLQEAQMKQLIQTDFTFIFLFYLRLKLDIGWWDKGKIVFSDLFGILKTIFKQTLFCLVVVHSHTRHANLVRNY